MKGLGTNEAVIINILTSRSNAHICMLKQRYKALLGRYLVKDLKSELSGHFEDICIGLLESPYELDCRNLYEGKYENEIKNFNEIIKENKTFILSQKELINGERNSIKNYKKVLDDEYGSERITDEAIELGRKEIIGECINYLKDNQMNEYGIKELQNIINNIHTSK